MKKQAASSKKKALSMPPSAGPSTPPPVPRLIQAVHKGPGLSKDASKVSAEHDYDNTEEIPKLIKKSNKDLLSKRIEAKKSKKKKASALMTEDMFEKARDTVEETEHQYKGDFLTDIKKFDMKNLKKVKPAADDFLELDDSENETEFEKRPKTIGQKSLYLSFINETSRAYPVESFQYIMLQLDARSEFTLDFSGISVMTDFVFALASDLRQKETSRFNCVEHILLDGCHLISDAGLKWLAQAFPNISSVSLVGCIKVTDIGIISLCNLCPRLVSLDLGGTNVNFLPKKWIGMEGIRMTCCPVLYPLAPADAKEKKGKQFSLKAEGKDLLKIAILHHGAIEVSVLAALKGEKQPALKSLLPVQHHDGFAVDSDLIASVSESTQAFSDLFVTNRSVVVFPSTLRDKTKIHDEAATIVAAIISIAVKNPDTRFIIVGCSSDAQGVMPTDVIYEEIISYAKKIAKVIRERYPVLSSDPKRPPKIDKMTVEQQLTVSRAIHLLQLMENLSSSLTSLEINVDKDCNGLITAISNEAKCLSPIKHVLYDKDIWEWASNFSNKCPQALKTGIHSLNQAAGIMASNFDLKERLRSFGAVYFLSSVGQLCMWQNSENVTMVANTAWLCQIFKVLLSCDQNGVRNDSQNHIIADDCMVWGTKELSDVVRKEKMSMKEVERVAKEFPQLFVVGQTTVTAWTKLPETSSMPLNIFTSFDKSSSEYDCLHIMYSFVLDQNLTPSVLHMILSHASALHVPVHAWQTGVIINEGIVAILIGQTGYTKLINLCAYVTKPHVESESVANLIWNTIEKYKIMLQYCLATAHIDPEEICRASSAIFPAPAHVAGVFSDHELRKEARGSCGRCGDSASEVAMLNKFRDIVSPSFFEEKAVSMSQLKGTFTCSMFEFQGPCVQNVKCTIGPLTNQWCGITMVQGNVRLMIVSFRCEQASASITLKNGKIEVSIDGKNEEVDISKKLQQGTLQGIVLWGHFSFTTVCTISLYMGPSLLHSAEVPYGSYRLVVDSTNFQEIGNSTSITVHGVNFQESPSKLVPTMKLEAKDKENPSLLCVATVVEVKDNQVLIHFDGWTQRYDYWTDFSDSDLHPLGYVAHRKGTLQRPKGYRKTFDWLTYLKEEDAEPVPFSFFDEGQKQGCPSNETDRIVQGLGLMVSSLSQKMCTQNLHRTSYYQMQVKTLFEMMTPDSNDAQGVIEQIPSSKVIPSMKLEAKDKENPSLLCVATVLDVKDNQLLIHFDGWSRRYDYWTNFSDKDLHPLGYVSHNNNSLQPPYGYKKRFDWLTYLKETNSEPVPYSFFDEGQKKGCPSDETDRILQGLGQMKKPFDLRHMTDMNKQEGLVPHVCLPSELSLQSLRFPVMSDILSLKKLKIHILCEGQGLELHFVNHSGMLMQDSEIVSTWFRLNMVVPYIQLLLQKQILPPDPSAIIKDSEGVAKEKADHLEKGLKRLLHIYIMYFCVTRPSAQEDRKELETVRNKFRQFLSKLLKDTVSIAKNFSIAQDTYICHAHQLADSPNMSITDIDLQRFEGMTSRVYRFNMKSNPIKSMPADFFTHFHNLTQLFMDRCNLTELPPFADNHCLEEIFVMGNKLTSLPDDIKQLKALRVLHISNNPLEFLPPCMSSLESLTTLAADNIGTIDLNLICSLPSLRCLNISFNYIESIPEKFGSLPLKTLYMAGLPFMTSRETFSSINVLKFMDNIMVYRRISMEEQRAMVEKVESSGETANSAKIVLFNKFLLEKYPRIGKMKKEKDGEISPAILKLKSLLKLNLSNNAFTSVPDSIRELTQVTSLNFDSNPRLESVSAELAKLPLKELHLRDCPILKTPPKEVVRRGFLAVFGYLKRLLQGSVACKRTKLMMVGLGGAGKTSLVRALTNEDFHFYGDYGEQITDGIDITEWLVDTKKVKGVVDENSEEPLHFSVWDFAGQTVYYNTHQFFLSNRAVYLLLWNIRLGFEHAGLDFWLSSIACHAPKAPILVVGTHCDKVQKGKLPREELKRRFPQIYSFHYVSSYSGEGIEELEQTLIRSALEQKYMGEKIPEAWLSLETGLNLLRKDKTSLVPWAKIEEFANTAGIFDNVELIQVVQFLHDLGSVQFFNTNFLRSHVVIVPQWIVDVMACIVTVHEGPIKEGKLLYSDMAKLWQDYPAELHPWLLRLTEEFDLTFPIANEEVNIVPCLLPNSAPKYEFSSLNKDRHEREALMIYRFDYLPAGLFNRAQVRLHQFSDSAVMWKKGFMLKKNNHRALLLQVSNTEVFVTARGYKPENILFLVHEVFECLIADSYTGVSYDFSIPCLECATDDALEPSMFSASKIKRAFDMKAPFLQCDKNFHIISIPEIQAVMPPDKNSDFDEHLGRSVRELQDLEQGTGIKVLFIYSQHNIPDLDSEGKLVNPVHVLGDLRNRGFNVSYCDDPETASMESMTLSIKAAQIVIIGISDEFVKSKQCQSLIIYTKQTLKKNIILVVFGSSLSWQKTDINIVLSDEVFVKMTDQARYKVKIKELDDAIKNRITSKKKDIYPECFISYCWSNSQNAIDLGSPKKEGALGWGDPRKVCTFLQEKGVNCWLDTNHMGQEGFFEDIADGLRKAKVMVACVSDEYAASKNCKMEFRFAVSTLRIPTILAVVGTGYNWERSEIGLLTVGHSQNCPKVNLQYENEAGMLDLLKAVQSFIPKSGDAGSKDNYTTEQQQNIAFQEVLELTQRKFLRHITMYSDNMDSEPYPRLLIVDMKRKSDGAEAKQPDSGGDAQQQGDIDLEDEREKSDTYCFRILCEHEQGWHESPQTISFPAKDSEALDNFLQSVSPYLARVMAILKHTSLSLPILNTPKGEKLRRNIEEWCTRSNSDFQSEYSIMLDCVLDEDVNRKYGGLKKCNMPNGKTLWLCPEHEKYSFTQTEEKYKDQIYKGVPQRETEETDFEEEKKKEDEEENEEEKGEDTIYTAASIGGESSSSSDGDNLSTASVPLSSTDSQAPESKPRHQSVVLQQPKGASGLPPKRPKLNRSTSGRKTTSQACLLM